MFQVLCRNHLRGYLAQRQLLSDASNELRSPLARLQVALELVWQRSGGQAEKELSRMETEIERLNELIGRLLEPPAWKQEWIPLMPKRWMYGNYLKNS